MTPELKALGGCSNHKQNT